MKIDILMGMLLTLLAKGKMQAKQLANKYEISVRSVYRYISLLDSSGVPISTSNGRNGGIEILNTFKLDSMYFTLTEKMILLSACNEIKNKELQQNIITKLQMLK